MRAKRFVAAENRGRKFGFEKNLKPVAWCRKNSKGGTPLVSPYFCKHKFFGSVRDSNPPPLLLTPRKIRVNR